jgi:hypothetical protein
VVSDSGVESILFQLSKMLGIRELPQSLLIGDLFEQQYLDLYKPLLYGYRRAL